MDYCTLQQTYGYNWSIDNFANLHYLAQTGDLPNGHLLQSHQNITPEFG